MVKRWRSSSYKILVSDKSFRFGADCAKRLPDSVLVHVERQTFVQDVPKLELFYDRRIL